MRKILLLLFIVIAINSCINIKSEYPQIKYYSLKQEPIQISSGAGLDIALQIRHLTISDEFNTDQIIAHIGSNRIKAYYYNRWASNFNDLLSDFITNRFSTAGLFKKGAFKSSSITLPDYIIEGRIVSIDAFNAEDKPGESWAELVMSMNLLERSPEQVGLKQIFNKTYTQRIMRLNANVESIPEALSKAASIISDMIMVDIINSVKK